MRFDLALRDFLSLLNETDIATATDFAETSKVRRAIRVVMG
jgi:hypothetical protein